MAPAPLHTLIRLHRLHLDERRRALAILQGEEAALEGLIHQQDTALIAEKHVAEKSEDARVVFPAYLKANRARRAVLIKQRDDLRVKIATASDAIAEAFQEVKRYELAQEARDAAALAEEQRQERLLFDEVGQTLHQRKKD